VRSSRRLEAETHRNIEVIWLLRHLKPDFKTIADFRRDNRNAFRQVFREFVLLCRQLVQRFRIPASMDQAVASI
jgi:transposase